MDLQQAVMLIRSTFTEEQKGDKGGDNSIKYKKALEEYPVIMATAMAIWCNENTKTL